MIVDAQIIHGFVQTLMSLLVGFVVLRLFGREGPKRIVPCQMFGRGRLCQDTVAAFERGVNYLLEHLLELEILTS